MDPGSHWNSINEKLGDKGVVMVPLLIIVERGPTNHGRFPSRPRPGRGGRGSPDPVETLCH